MACFADMRQLHDLMQLLVTAGNLPLSEPDEAERDTLLRLLCPKNLTPEHAKTLASGEVKAKVYRFLRSLASLVTSPRNEN